MVGILALICVEMETESVAFLDESDEEDDGLPKRKRRFQAERAAEGMEVDDDQVNI